MTDPYRSQGRKPSGKSSQKEEAERLNKKALSEYFDVMEALDVIKSFVLNLDPENKPRPLNWEDWRAMRHGQAHHREEPQSISAVRQDIAEQLASRLRNPG